MAKTTKAPKKTAGITPFLTSSWMDIDRSIENLRKDMEKAFSSFPSISMPKMPESSCDVIDEGNQFRVKMNVPGVQKKDINLKEVQRNLRQPVSVDNRMTINNSSNDNNESCDNENCEQSESFEVSFSWTIISNNGWTE